MCYGPFKMFFASGKLPRDWFDIPGGTPVSAGLGDLQCSVVSTLGTLYTSYTKDFEMELDDQVLFFTVVNWPN